MGCGVVRVMQMRCLAASLWVMWVLWMVSGLQCGMLSALWVMG